MSMDINRLQAQRLRGLYSGGAADGSTANPAEDTTQQAPPPAIDATPTNPVLSQIQTTNPPDPQLANGVISNPWSLHSILPQPNGRKPMIYLGGVKAVPGGLSVPPSSPSGGPYMNPEVPPSSSGPSVLPPSIGPGGTDPGGTGPVQQNPPSNGIPLNTPVYWTPNLAGGNTLGWWSTTQNGPGTPVNYPASGPSGGAEWVIQTSPGFFQSTTAPGAGTNPPGTNPVATNPPGTNPGSIPITLPPTTTPGGAPSPSNSSSALDSNVAALDENNTFFNDYASQINDPNFTNLLAQEQKDINALKGAQGPPTQDQIAHVFHEQQALADLMSADAPNISQLPLVVPQILGGITGIGSLNGPNGLGGSGTGGSSTDQMLIEALMLALGGGSLLGGGLGLGGFGGTSMFGGLGGFGGGLGGFGGLGGGLGGLGLGGFGGLGLGGSSMFGGLGELGSLDGFGFGGFGMSPLGGGSGFGNTNGLKNLEFGFGSSGLGGNPLEMFGLGGMNGGPQHPGKVSLDEDPRA